MKRLILAVAAFAALPAFAQDMNEHPCVQQVHKFVSFRDPDTVKVVTLSEGKAEIIDYAGTRLMAFRFDVKRSRSTFNFARPSASSFSRFVTSDSVASSLSCHSAALAAASSA